ncbi:MAG: hypothetical protein ACK4N5_07220, partial [Myxococcales bacterium]
MDLPQTRFLETRIQMPLLELPVRSVVLELSNARILFSPGSRLTPEHHRDAGAITDIVAPALLHTAGMARAAEAHPQARLWGPEGAREKLPTLRWHGILGQNPWPYEEELARIPLRGMPAVNENVFLHRATRTLYVTDLVFHITDPEGVGAALFYRLFGTYRRFAVSRLFLMYAKDRAALAASAADPAELDFVNVVPT